MKPKKFRIRNYKSIIDSGDCYFSDDNLTIFAGKNESGKTSILEALADFHENSTIKETSVPIDTDITNPENLPCIKITFEIEKEDIEEIISKIDEKFKDYISAKKVDVTLIKKYGSQEYEINEENKSTLLTETSNEEVSEFWPIFIKSLVSTKLPYFILFSSFDDVFPSSIETSQFAQNEWAKDLELVSNLSIEKIISPNAQTHANHQEAVNTEFSEKFKKYWTQDEIKLQIKRDGTILNFWIVENAKHYFPSQRSKGQQWYLSFFVKIVAKLTEDKPNIILIDEPGLYLHAKAQKDLLEVLTNHLDNNPILFSTHSPYLITEDNLENIRLVEKVDNTTGSKILGKIHAHQTADKETLTPILTAIGLSINDSITNLEQKNNVVVEGPEDVFYLQGFKFLKNTQTNFINGGGATNMGMVGAILQGWGSNVYYLYDNDQGKKDGEKRLSKWKVSKNIIKSVLKVADTAIVDIFSIEDFKKIILLDETLDYTVSNSEYIKSLKKESSVDKVLLARTFLQKVKNSTITIDDFSDVTKKNIDDLLSELNFTNYEN